MSRYEVRGGGATYTSPRQGSQTAWSVRKPQERVARWAVERAKASLRELEDLTPGWDGYGAAPLSRKVRLNAWHALEQAVGLGLIADVSPRSDGTISLEWEINGTVAHLQIGSNSYSMYVDKGASTQFFSGAVKDGMRQGLLALRNAVGTGVSEVMAGSARR
jgi:hypothetical protein